MPTFRYCWIPSDVVSTTQCVHPSFTICDMSCCTTERPGMVMWYAFNDSFSPMRIFAVLIIPVLYPPAERHAQIKLMEDVFPFVPVTPMTTMFREGKPYQSAPSHAAA